MRRVMVVNQNAGALAFRSAVAAAPKGRLGSTTRWRRRDAALPIEPDPQCLAVIVLAPEAAVRVAIRKVRCCCLIARRLPM